MLAFGIQFAEAREITKERAIQVASNFLSDKGVASRSNGDVMVSYTSFSTDSTDAKAPNYYVCSFDNTADGGFVVVAADDALPEVLGYSASGNFEKSMENPAFSDWMAGYDHIIQYVRHKKLTGNTDITVKSRADRNIPDVAPLIRTTWGQGTPYNDYCPVVEGQRAPSGCVATAMAQVMYYHKWPKVGHGSHDGVTFEGTEYKWDLMNRKYREGSYSAEAGDAVATLMRHCGVAVDMEYGPNESGTCSSILPYALCTYFDYDPTTVKTIYRECEEYDVFIDALYTELESERPVLFSAKHLQGGGHQFIVDGCSPDGYFHFNWGWDGYDDNDFLILDIDAPDYNNYINANGYVDNQVIVVGVQPNSHSGAGFTLYPDLWSEGLYVSVVNEKSLLIRSNYFVNHGWAMHTFYLGAKFTNKVTGDVYYSEPSNIILDNTRIGWSFSKNNQYSVAKPSKISDGVYMVEPVFKVNLDDEWHKMLIPLTGIQSSPLMVENGNFKSIPIKIEVSDFYFSPKYESGITANGNVVITNPSDYPYSNYLSIREQSKTKLYTDISSTEVFVPAHTTMEISFPFYSFAPNDDYVITLFDADETALYSIEGTVTNSFSVEINESNFPDPVFRQSLTDWWEYETDGILTPRERFHYTGFGFDVNGYSGIKSLKGIEYLTTLTYLGAQNQKIDSLRLAGHPSILRVDAYENNLSLIDFSNCSELNYVVAYSNRLSQIDLTNCHKLDFLCLNINEIENIDLDDCENITNIQLHSNKLRAINLENCLKLQTILLANNNLVAVDLSKNDNLQRITLDNNQRTVPVTPQMEFDLNTLNPDGFDINKASDWRGGTVTGNILKFNDDKVTYMYDTGRGKYMFALLKGEVTSITAVADDSTNISVSGHTLAVTGNSLVANVYSADGRLIYQGKESVITLPSSGVYIVKVGNRTEKVIVR